MKRDGLKLFRRRYIPDELIQLTGFGPEATGTEDEILYLDDKLLITRWKALHPRADFAGGVSAFFLDKGWKVSKIIDLNGEILHWYCDICDYVIDEAANSITYEDLLFDVVVFPNEKFKVLDCDEAAEALSKGLISQQQLTDALYSLHELLEVIYHARFDRLQVVIEAYENP